MQVPTVRHQVQSRPEGIVLYVYAKHREGFDDRDDSGESLQVASCATSSVDGE